MAFIEPMHRNKPNITYLLTYIKGFTVDHIYVTPRSLSGMILTV